MPRGTSKDARGDQHHESSRQGVDRVFKRPGSSGIARSTGCNLGPDTIRMQTISAVVLMGSMSHSADNFHHLIETFPNFLPFLHHLLLLPFLF